MRQQDRLDPPHIHAEATDVARPIRAGILPGGLALCVIGSAPLSAAGRARIPAAIQKSSVRALSVSPASISAASWPAIWSASTCP